MKRSNLIVLLLMLLVFVSCQREDSYKRKLYVDYESLEPKKLEPKNYYKALFSIDTADFVAGLKAIQNDYPPFLSGNLDNPKYVNHIKYFVTDTFCLMIHDEVEKKFTDLSAMDDDIKSVYQRFKYYYPEYELPPVYYHLSGIDRDTPPVGILHNAVCVGLDYYLGKDNKIYGYLGMPEYRAVRCQPEYVTRDLANAIFYYNIYKSRIQIDVLTEMIFKGKENFFYEAMDPNLPDSILLGYSSSQMQWAEEHEEDVWTYIVGNNMLYAKGLDAYRKFFGDGPFTRDFPTEAPARLGEYIGLQIVRSYMSHNDVSLRELMDNNDIKQIFQNSQYKPKK